jgi:hypothetical protein
MRGDNQGEATRWDAFGMDLRQSRLDQGMVRDRKDQPARLACGLAIRFAIAAASRSSIKVRCTATAASRVAAIRAKAADRREKKRMWFPDARGSRRCEEFRGAVAAACADNRAPVPQRGPFVSAPVAPPRPLNTRSTVAVPTPARRAIVWKVGFGIGPSTSSRWGFASAIAQMPGGAKPADEHGRVTKSDGGTGDPWARHLYRRRPACSFCEPARVPRAGKTPVVAGKLR